MTEDVAQKLWLRRIKCPLVITGITQEPKHVAHKVRATIKSKHTPYTVNTDFIVLPTIIGHLPTRRLDTATWNVSCITLADPSFGEPGKIDLLIGQELFFDLLLEGKIKHKNLPFIQNTKLGWIVGGAMTDSISTKGVHCSIEEPVPQRPIIKSEEQECEKDNAVRKLMQVERRFMRQANLQAQYKHFMKDYEDLSHMEEERENLSSNIQQGPEFYLPHHPVTVAPHVWKKRSAAPMNDLQRRRMCRTPYPALQASRVLMKEEYNPLLPWSMGRALHRHPQGRAEASDRRYPGSRRLNDRLHSAW